MRFRAKFDRLDVLYLALPLFMLVLLLSGPQHASPLLRIFAVLWGLLGLFRVLDRFCTYWDVASDGLRERRFWSVRFIPWAQMSSVAPWPDGKPLQGAVVIDFSRPAPLSSTGRVIANPDRLDEFLAELREHALQARFAVPSASSILPLPEIRSAR
jgi:hypothetical protein